MPSRLLIPLLLFAALSGAPLHAAPSPLKDHPSPYLAMHADDPVLWRLWGEEAFAEARATGRPLFVSLGFYTCRWCHVMQRESFRDPRIAATLNRAFIPIKVDRELDPGLDAKLLDFVKRTQGSGGWPLNVVVTPEGYPLVGFVYLPPARVAEVLGNLERRWKAEPARLARLAREASTALEGGASAAAPTADPLETLATAALEAADTFEGGFGQQSKFPEAARLLALLELLARRPDEALAAFLRTTLDQMAHLGLRDHLAGGFFRYAVDPGWREPHYEKLLVDNAQLAALYLAAAEPLAEPRYEAIGRETLDFMIHELTTAEGGFVAGLSAEDDQGTEGGYYLWPEAELERILDEGEREALLAHSARLEGGVLPIPAEGEALAPPIRSKLLAARATRGLPRDEKRITAWNALALSALARGARLDGGERYREAGRRLHRQLTRAMMRDGRPLRALTPNGAVSPANLEDYALLARALDDWAAVEGEGERELRRSLAAEGWALFHDPAGWRLDQRVLLRYRSALPALRANDLPSPSALLIALSLGEPWAEATARTALERGRAAAFTAPLEHPELLLLLGAD